MIEIIKKGTKEKCTCKECGCIFTYEEKDILTITIALEITPIDTRNSRIQKSIICPQCNHKINLYQEK